MPGRSRIAMSDLSKETTVTVVENLAEAILGQAPRQGLEVNNRYEYLIVRKHDQGEWVITHYSRINVEGTPYRGTLWQRLVDTIHEHARELDADLTSHAWEAQLLGSERVYCDCGKFPQMSLPLAALV